MAKLAFSKLAIKLDNSVLELEFNGQKIEVKKYLPVQEKLEMISDIINFSADENRFYNPKKIEVFTVIEMLDRYTNLSFSKKDKEDPAKLYDLVISSGLFDKFLTILGIEEFYEVCRDRDETVKAIYSYNSSLMGILDAISQDYSNLNLEASEIQKKLADPENMALLKNVLSKLG